MEWRDLWHMNLLAVWHLLRAPLLALAVTLAARRIGARGAPMLALLAAGLGLVVGWFALFGLPSTAHVLIASHATADRVRFLAVASLLAAALAANRVPAVALLLAVCIGWWMAGAPTTRPALIQDGPTLLVAAAIAWLFAALICPSGGPGRALAGTAALAGALAAVGAPSEWLILALIPLACAAGLLPDGAAPEALLPVAAGMAIACVAVVQTSGRLPRGGFGGIDAACLAPLLTLWLSARLIRLRPLLREPLSAALGIGFAVLAPRVIAWF